MLTEVLVLVAVFAIAYAFLNRRPKNYPPGPVGIPVLGHLPLLGQSPYKTLLEWKKKYGPLIGVDFGSFPCVAINDAKLIREAFNHGSFLGRPPMEPFLGRSGGVPKGIIFTEGHTWMEQRRFALRNLRDFGFGTNLMEVKIQDEVIELMERLEKTAGQPVQMRNLFNAAILNALWSIMLGERMKQDDPELKEAIERLTASVDENNLLASLVIFLPWMAKVAPKLSGFEKMMKEFPPILAFVQNVLDKHEVGRVADQPRDLMDIYADEVDKTTDPNSSFHKDQGNMMFTLTDLFAAGTETTSTALTWLFAYMVTWPEIQNKFHKQIHDVVGTERLPSLIDRPSMPYVEAVLNEVLRYSSFVPMAPFRAATETAEFHGFTIPKGTSFVANLYASHYDVSIWGDPQNFRPERFIDESGKFKKNENLMPFGTGKRFCLGESLARDELFIFSTHLFQRFQVMKGKELPDIDNPSLGAVLLPRPFEVILKKR